LSVWRPNGEERCHSKRDQDRNEETDQGSEEGSENDRIEREQDRASATERRCADDHEQDRSTVRERRGFPLATLPRRLFEKRHPRRGLEELAKP
jgi:hypothetical protein